MRRLSGAISASHADIRIATAYRDILDLVERGALRKDTGGGRSTTYSLVIP
jgi:Fic family protein